METERTHIQKTRQGRYALFCASGFLFSIDGETLVKGDVEEGVCLSDGQMEALRAQSDTRRAKDKALLYLSLRSHGRQELCRKLEKNFDRDTAQAACQAMEDLGLVDDHAFARAMARHYIEIQGRSVREAGQKLRFLGVDKALVDAALEPYTGSQADAVEALIAKSYLGRLRRGEGEKVKAALLRRGFSYSDVEAGLGRFSHLFSQEDGYHYDDYEV